VGGERGENVTEESEDMIETRIVLISPDSDVTPEQLKSRALMLINEVRGFPIGDKRVCRATRKGGPRPGFHQLELEYKLLPRVRRALDLLEKGK